MFDPIFIAIAFFMFMSFFLSGSETALTAANRMKAQTKAEAGDRASVELLKLLSKPDRMITTILIGNNIANIMLPTLVTIVAIDRGFSVGLATGILTVALILFAEVIPKSVAATFSDRIAYMVYPVIRFLVLILSPLTYILSFVPTFIIRLLSKGQIKEATISKEELKTMVDIATSEGTFQDEEYLRIRGVLDFQTKNLRDALQTPRVDMIGIPSDADFEMTREIVMEHNYTRYPVYKDNMDNIVGVFHSKQLITWSVDPTRSLDEFIDDEPLFVIHSLSMSRVFKMMLKERRHIAIVLDEYGGTLGLITTEDIIETMIGQDIADETDDQEDVLIEELTESHIICHGKLTLHRFNEAFKTRLPEEEDTVSGFIFSQLRDFPDEGATFDYQHLRFTVNKTDQTKIVQVLVEKRDHSDELEVE